MSIATMPSILLAALCLLIVANSALVPIGSLLDEDADWEKKLETKSDVEMHEEEDEEYFAP